MAQEEVLTADSIQEVKDAFTAAVLNANTAADNADTNAVLANSAASDASQAGEDLQSAIADVLAQSDVDPDYISYVSDQEPDFTGAPSGTIGAYFNSNGLQKLEWNGSTASAIGEPLTSIRNTGKKVNTIADLDTPTAFEVLFNAVPTREVLGFKTVSDGGTGIFTYRTELSKSLHDGAIHINPEHNSTIGSEAWFTPAGDSTDDSGTGIWVREYTWSISDSWWGVKYDGHEQSPTDNYTALAAMISFVEINGGLIVAGKGVAEYNGELKAFSDDSVYNLKLWGQGTGNGGTTWRCTSSSGTAFQVSSSQSLIDGMVFEGNGVDTDTTNGLRFAEDNSNGPASTHTGKIRILNFLGGAGMLSKGFWEDFKSLRIYNCKDGFLHEGGGGATTISGGSSITNCTRYGIAFSGPAKHFNVKDTNIENCATGVFGGGESTGVDVITFTNVHFEGNTERDTRFGVGTQAVFYEGCRLGGTNSLSENSIEHVGGSGKFSLTFKACVFVDNGQGTNTEVIYAGPNVAVIYDDFETDLSEDVSIAGITLNSNGAYLQPRNSAGRQQTITADSSPVAIDVQDGSYIILDLQTDFTLVTPDNLIIGQYYYIDFRQGGTGGHVCTFSSAWDNAPFIRTGANTNTATKWIAVTDSKLRYVGSKTENPHKLHELTIGSGTTYNFDFSTGRNKQVTLEANGQFGMPANVIPGEIYLTRFVQDGTGSHTASWLTAWKGAASVSLNATAGSITSVFWMAINEDTLVYLNHNQE